MVIHEYYNTWLCLSWVYEKLTLEVDKGRQMICYSTYFKNLLHCYALWLFFSYEILV
jgi:hypothetical protein